VGTIIFKEIFTRFCDHINITLRGKGPPGTISEMYIQDLTFYDPFSGDELKIEDLKAEMLYNFTANELVKWHVVEELFQTKEGKEEENKNPQIKLEAPIPLTSTSDKGNLIANKVLELTNKGIEIIVNKSLPIDALTIKLRKRYKEKIIYTAAIALRIGDLGYLGSPETEILCALETCEEQLENKILEEEGNNSD
jgi:hypothetical protein